MVDQQWLAQRFEQHRGRLRAVSYRMLGSFAEAEDAVQETWLRLSRSESSQVENLGGWLTTIVARVCLNMLRARQSRPDGPLDLSGPEPASDPAKGTDPEHEAILTDSVGLAMLVVLHKLTPAERVAFVLHDVFAVPFDEIAPIVGRSQAATRQLASRARRRVRGDESRAPDAELASHREVVDAFLAAARAGDLASLVAVLDPDIVLRSDQAPAIVGDGTEVTGPVAVARLAIEGGARDARSALVDGALGIVVAPRGRLSIVLRLHISDGRIVEMDAIADPARLRRVDLTVLDD